MTDAPAPDTDDEILLGVEEEFLLVDAESYRPAPRIEEVIERADQRAGDQAQAELHRAQIELASSPCLSLGDLRADVLELRRTLVASAGVHGCSVVASGTFPGVMGPPGRLITAKDRYEEMERANPMLAREQLICGCHIHVSAPDPSTRITTMNSVRRWLPALLALSTNSPFWEGEDTGFASYRNEVWVRWPTAGPIGSFESMDEYDDMVASLVKAEVILDDGMAYWDVRPSKRFPTLEIRIADVMADIDTVVAVAALARALVATYAHGAPPESSIRPELLRAATWRAAVSGLSGGLIDPTTGTRVPAREALDGLVALVGPELDQRGETDLVVAAIEALVDRGTGADAQRAAYARRGRLSDVIDGCTLGERGEAVPWTG